jgi:parvulin-like peptidyl-prolyl isomerase
MSKAVTICGKEILHQIMLSCQVPTIIEGILTRKIVTRTAKEHGINAEPEELQEAADALRLMNNLQSAEATWSWLQNHALSLDDFEELVEINVITSKLAHHLFGAKVEPFFVEHQLEYVQAVTYEVVLDDADLAMEIFYAIEEGEISFHEVAHRYILDPEQRRCGGYRGALCRQDLKPEISAAVFAATPSQVLRPIVTSKGAHLILVEEILSPTLDEILRYKIITSLFSEWLKQKIEAFEVEISLQPSSLEVQVREMAVGLRG